MTHIYQLVQGTVLAHGKPLGDPAELYFSPPKGDRLATALAGLCRAQSGNDWRTYGETRSCASSSENPLVHDSESGQDRPLHDITVSVTFALHPQFGTGHIVGTNGDVTAFWDGESLRLVRHESLTLLKVVWGDAQHRPSERSRRAAERQAFLDAL